jgi:hypothetical protein
MQGLREFWRQRGRLGKTVIVVVAALIVLSIIGAFAGGSDDSGGANTDAASETTITNDATEPVDTTETTETTETDEASGGPISCLEGAGLSDAEARGADFWRAVHESPFYQVSVDLLGSPAEARQAVKAATAVYASQAGEYAVTGPLLATADGSLLSDSEGTEAGAVVEVVAVCLR